MKVRFQADADLNQDIVRGVLRREPSINFQTANVAGLRSLNDLDVLELASRENRILVSHDRRTMPRAFSDFIRQQTSPGLIIVSQRVDVLSAINGLILIWAASEPSDWTNQIATIPF